MDYPGTHDPGKQFDDLCLRDSFQVDHNATHGHVHAQRHYESDHPEGDHVQADQNGHGETATVETETDPKGL